MQLPVVVHAEMINEATAQSDLGPGPWVDLHGTPWGQIEIGRDALAITGTPSIHIPAGIPQVT